MAYNANLAERVRARLNGTDGDVRVGPDRYGEELARPGARPFDFTGRAMTGWVYVAAGNVAHGRSLTRWVDLGVWYAGSLPRKASRVRAGAQAPSKRR